MRLITRFELAAKDKNELHALLRNVFNELARSESDTHQQETLWHQLKIFKEKSDRGHYAHD